MKSKEISEKYGLNHENFENWWRKSDFPKDLTFTGMLKIPVKDSQGLTADILVAEYREFLEQQAALGIEEEKRQEQIRIQELDKQKSLSQMLITSGFSFDGYTITKYSGYISGDDAISMDRPRHGWFGTDRDVADDLLEGLVQIRRRALTELKEAAYALGCNAVVGVDFDYITLDPETASSQGGTVYLPFLFAVTANGNAVVIEKN